MTESTYDEPEIRRSLIGYFNSIFFLRFYLPRDLYEEVLRAGKRRIINDHENFTRCPNKELVIQVFEKMEAEFIQ
jgi:hypothetical protein